MVVGSDRVEVCSTRNFASSVSRLEVIGIKLIVFRATIPPKITSTPSDGHLIILPNFPSRGQKAHYSQPNIFHVKYLYHFLSCYYFTATF